MVLAMWITIYIHWEALYYQRFCGQLVINTICMVSVFGYSLLRHDLDGYYINILSMVGVPTNHEVDYNYYNIFSRCVHAHALTV